MTADRIAAVVIFVAAVQYARMARTYHGLTVADVVGPSAYPLIIGGLAALLAVLLFLRATLRPVEGTFWTRHGRPTLLAASLLAYVRLLEPVGFLLSTFVFLSLAHLWLGERSWLRAVGLGAVITAALWLLFARLLGVVLPVGLLGVVR